MKLHSLVLVCACAIGALNAVAQPAPVAPAASAPKIGPKQPRLRSPAEQRDSATTPGEVRPEDPVVPQISLPLGRKPPVPELSAAEARRRHQAAAAGGVDDSVARCKALTTRAARADCLHRQRRAASAP